MPEVRSETSVLPSSSANDVPPRVCAVVVAYFPDEGFSERVEIVLPQVDILVVVDNTPNGVCKWRTEAWAENNAKVRCIENHANLGIAAALNQGLDQALQTGCQWLLTLDQDTRCYPDMVQTLLGVVGICDLRPTVIGGNYFDAKRRRLDAPAGRHADWLERKTVITSGCLVDAAFAHAVGGFREDYFIDQVDHEFCLRIRSHGGHVVITGKPVMNHSVGGQTGPNVPLIGQMLPEHSALRKYYITRNTVATVASYWAQEPGWCLRRGIRLLLGLGCIVFLERNKIAKLSAFAQGLADGLRRRMGPCRRTWLQGDE